MAFRLAYGLGKKGRCLRRLCGLVGVLVALSGWAVRAEPVAIVRIEAGQDVLEARAAQILMVEVQSEVGGPRVVVTLDPALRTALQVLTAGHLREEVIIRVCGQVVSRPMLWAPVLDGVFAIQGDDLPKAQHLAQVLQAKDCGQAPSA